jgi:hypothetical protein
MDLSIPSYMDGRLIEQALRPEFLRARLPKRHQAELSHQRTSQTPYTAEQLREVTQRLEDLGYL